VGQLTSLISGRLIAFDTGPLIYYIEEHPDYLSRADELFSALDSGAALGMTSVLTLQEVLWTSCGAYPSRPRDRDCHHKREASGHLCGRSVVARNQLKCHPFTTNCSGALFWIAPTCRRFVRLQLLAARILRAESENSPTLERRSGASSGLA